MELTNLYKGLSDPQRIRILNLLGGGALCVCHLVEILESEQVKISKQLRYLKQLGLVAAERQAQWMVYSLAEPVHPLVVRNLETLRELGGRDLGLGADLRKRAEILERIEREGCPCPDLGEGACCTV